MNKKFFTIIMAAVLVCSAVCTAAPASAASQKVYMQTDFLWGSDTPREKVGDYYIWAENKYENGTYSGALKCAKSLKNGAAKTLKKLTSKTKKLNETVLTDGNTIYYVILDYQTHNGIIYKTTVKGTAHKKVKTVKYFSGFSGLAAFYDGKIYYNAYANYTAYTNGHPFYAEHLYSYDIATKKTRLEKKNYVADSGYGRYMSGGYPPTDVSNWKHELYDGKTGKSTSLGEGLDMVISGKTVYSITVTYNLSDYTAAYTLKQCDLSGKNEKTIIKIPENMDTLYMGRKAAYFKERSTGKIKKLTYSTKKFTTVK